MLEGIENIIFDLGGVIVNIDYDKTIDAFSRLSGNIMPQIFNKYYQSKVFAEFEIGSFSAQEFRSQVKKKFGFEATDKKFDKAWSAMLLDTPPERLELLLDLKEKKRTFLLSNTNKIHIRDYNKILQKEFNHYLENFFEKVYLSHLVKKRKPDVSIYKQVVSENNLDPRKTLFVDDTETNIIGARKAGLQAQLITNELTINSLFEGWY